MDETSPIYPVGKLDAGYVVSASKLGKMLEILFWIKKFAE